MHRGTAQQGENNKCGRMFHLQAVLPKNSARFRALTKLRPVVLSDGDFLMIESSSTHPPCPPFPPCYCLRSVDGCTSR